MGLFLRMAMVLLALGAPATVFASTVHERLHGQLTNHTHAPLRSTCHAYSDAVMPLDQAQGLRRVRGWRVHGPLRRS